MSIVQISDKPAVVTVARRYELQCAHRLTMVPPAHKCSQLHGHTYMVSVELTGKIKAGTGWLIDFGAVDVAWGDLIHKTLDHKYLNEVEGLQNPTSELLAVWIARRLEVHFRGIAGVTLSAVEVAENHRSLARYEIDRG